VLTKLICYGKSAIGLGESLNIPATTDDLITEYQNEIDEYLNLNLNFYNDFCKTYHSGKHSQKSLHAFIKNEHKNGRLLGDIVTGDDMIDRVFNRLPYMADFLKNSAEEGLRNKFIRTPDIIGRIRFFKQPEYPSEEGEIKRQAQNYKIQGSSANMTKLAISLIKRYIEDNNLDHKIKFILPLHDEIRYLAREDFAEEALKIVVDKMEFAGKIILNNNLQKAEGEITEVWKK